ncbi:hypothetical protein EJB05_57242 [Eragrostis curvula]|uniref:FPL domain-containing protein n=1 Tax=Eragrostis curvula TaxID=38414 RepID=A0A5J9SDZ4_9POAL|nr:hypothetical protein EJB05_57242 [Eragrostis curvula]
MRCAPPPAAATAAAARVAWWPARQRGVGSAAGPCAADDDSESELDSRAGSVAAWRSGFADMWLFWRTRNRFSLEELRYLTDQLQKVHFVNEANKDFVIEALRSIAELMIYGDQHDPSFFEYFMEKQIMGEFARILRISKLSRVSLQLLQTMDYIFSNEHINFLITYPFDFRIDEMLSYYISFLRFGDKREVEQEYNFPSCEDKNDDVISFPLYAEALKFAFHEDSMIRVAIRTLTLNVQHFQKQCIDLDKLVVHSSRNTNSSCQLPPLKMPLCKSKIHCIISVMFMSSGIPDLERFITENILEVLVFRLLLPSLQGQNTDLGKVVTTSMYLLCCILHIFKNKDMSSTVAASLFHQPDSSDRKQETPNGYNSEHDHCSSENECSSTSAVEESIKTNLIVCLRS